MTLDRASVYLDCELVPHCPSAEAEPECWYASSPFVLVLSEPLCARLEAEGFESLDVLFECRTAGIC